MIGIIDSGIGGKQIEKEIQKLLSNAQIIYYKDSENFPYGNKSEKELAEILLKNCQELVEKKVNLIVLACNSGSISSLSQLRKKIKVPIIGVVPAIKPACELTKTKKIAVFATNVTCQSKALRDLVSKYARDIDVQLIPFKRLATEIEKNQIDLAKKNVEGVWAKYKDMGIDVIVLGCTHYPIIKKEIQKIVGPKVKLVDSNSAVAAQVYRVYNKIKR